MLEDILEFPLYAISHILNLKILYIMNLMYSFQIFFFPLQNIYFLMKKEFQSVILIFK